MKFRTLHAMDMDLVSKRLILSVNGLIAVSVIGMLLLLLAPLGAFALGSSCEELVYPLCVMMMIVVVWIFFTLKYISPDAFNLYSLFILTAILFNSGQALLEVFHLNEEGVLGGKFSSETLAHTLYLVLLSLVSFHMGGLLGVRKKSLSAENVTAVICPPAVSAKAMRQIGSLLLVISTIPFFMLMIDSLKIVLSSGYFALYQQDQSTGMDSGLEGVKGYLSGFFVPGLLFLLVGNKDRLTGRSILFLVLFMCACALMFFGYRGHATMLFMAGLWVWHRTVRPISLPKIGACGAALLFIIFPTIVLIRSVEGVSRLTLQFFKDAFLTINNPAVAAISEMGESMNTIAYTLELIPHERSFALGSTYAYVASSIIPNFFWSLHPATEYGGLGRWLTMTVDPERFASGGGLGYSFIAEAYANFGWIGTPIVLGLIGFILARLTRWSDSREDDARIVVVAGCMASILQWARGDCNIFFRPVFFYMLLPYMVFCYIRRKLYRKMCVKL